MSTFVLRRARNIALTVVLAAGLVLVNKLYDLSLRDASFLNGWLLATAVLFLALFNARKKLPFLPLMSAATWLQLHVYVGLLAVVLFALHTGLRVPHGLFEDLLWGAFVGLALSGFIGLYLCRTYPSRLRRHGEPVLFERIPAFRAQLAKEAEELVLSSVRESASAVLADLYADRLAAYFSRPRHLIAHLFESNRALHRLRREIGARERYLNARGREILGRLDELAVAKDNLDYQYALQLGLKGWLFVHIPLTYGMLLLVLLHVVLVYAFGVVAT